MNRRFALAANCLDGWRVFSKLGVAKPILNQAGEFSPLGSRLFQTCDRRINAAGKERKNYEFTDSAQNINFNTSHHTHAPVLWVFPKSTSRCSAARRWLSRIQHGGRTKRSDESHHRRWEYSSRLVFTL